MLGDDDTEVVVVVVVGGGGGGGGDDAVGAKGERRKWRGVHLGRRVRIERPGEPSWSQKD